MGCLTGPRGTSPIAQTEDFLNFHRDGTTGWKACKGRGSGCDCGSKGCKAYRDAVADSAQILLKDPSTMANGQRVCENIAHISDRRLKQDIVRTGTSRGGIPVYTFRYKPQANMGNGTHSGVMAQDLLSLPELAAYRGAVVTTEAGFFKVDYSQLG